MKIKMILTACMFFLFLFACCLKIKDDDPKPSEPLTMQDITAPDAFDWKTHKDIQINIGISTQQPISLFSKISVYDGDPQNGGSIIVSGAASSNKYFVTTVSVPSRYERLYLKCDFPHGLSLIEAVDAQEFVHHVFSDNVTKHSTSAFKSVKDEGPGCDDCDEIIEGSGSYTISHGKTFCITENFTGSVSFQSWNGGGTLKICGTATLNSLTLPNNAHLVLTQNGSLTVGNFNSNGANTIIVYLNADITFNSNFQTQGTTVEIFGDLAVYGNLTAQLLSSGNFKVSGNTFVEGNISVNGGITFINNGFLTHNGNLFKLNAQAALINNGTIEVIRPAGGHLQVNSNSSFTNNGTIDIIGDISINAGSSIVNNCALMCSGVFSANSGDFKNYTGYLKGAQQFTINSSNSTIELYDGSMIFSENFTYNNGQILGYGTLNSIYVTGTFGIYGNNLVSGTLETATDDLYLSSGGDVSNYFINGATLVGLDYATNYIPPNSCNPDGLIIDMLMADTDGDGVPDHLDDYPEDPYRAFNNYFPNKKVSATIVFEDLWPGKGDFDFNDLVVGIFGIEVTNASNEVVEVFVNLEVKAVGASLKNGFGWQFDNMSPSSVQQVTGAVPNSSGQSYVNLNPNGTEAGQDFAVIIAIENVEDVINRVGGSMFNTIDNGMIGTSDLVEIHVLFGENTPIERGLVALDNFNFFLIKNQNRDIEIHLADRRPTSLMNHPWGESHDTSDPTINRYYKTKSNLSWAILLLEPFEYPLENTPVIGAYPDFSPWAQSGGNTNKDWNKHPVHSKIWNN